MPSLEFSLIHDLTARADALDAVGTANGAADLAQMVGWLLLCVQIPALADFRNPNASQIVAALTR